MDKIEKLFNKITTIHPEKVGKLGLDGLEVELLSDVKLLLEEIWQSLPLKNEYSIHIDCEYIPLAPVFCSANLFESYLGVMNESIQKVRTLLNEIQKRTNNKCSDIKRRSNMPSVFCNGLSESNVEIGCNAMGIPCSLNNYIDYGENLFKMYSQASIMVEDYIMNMAKMIMTEDEIRELTDYNKFRGVFLPSLYRDNNNKLIEVCEKLIDKGYLDKNTSSDDFVYFFSGKGEAPKQNLKWVGNNVQLALFLDCYFTMFKNDIPEKWKKAQIIFKKNGLRQALTNSTNSTAESLIKERYDTFNEMLKQV